MKLKTVIARGVACASMGLGPLTASADFDVQLNWWVDGVKVGPFVIPGTPGAEGTYDYTGDFEYVDEVTLEVVDLSVDLTGKPDAADGFGEYVQLIGNAIVDNFTADPVDSHIELVLPTAAPYDGSGIQGQATIALTTDAGGGGVTSLIDTPVWQALFDGVVGGQSTSMFFDPFGMWTTGPGSLSTADTFGFPDPVPGPPIAASIGVNVSYSISSLDRVRVFSNLIANVPVGGDASPSWGAAPNDDVPCPGDVDGDGDVGVVDFLELLGAWGMCLDAPRRCPTDLDGNGMIDVVDVLELLARWGPCP
jgi:hypothetical protein